MGSAIISSSAIKNPENREKLVITKAVITSDDFSDKDGQIIGMPTNCYNGGVQINWINMSNYPSNGYRSAVNVENGGLGVSSKASSSGFIGFDSGVEKSLSAFTLVRSKDDGNTGGAFTIFSASSYKAKSAGDSGALISGLYLIVYNGRMEFCVRTNEDKNTVLLKVDSSAFDQWEEEGAIDCHIYYDSNGYYQLRVGDFVKSGTIDEETRASATFGSYFGMRVGANANVGRRMTNVDVYNVV